MLPAYPVPIREAADGNRYWRENMPEVLILMSTPILAQISWRRGILSSLTVNLQMDTRLKTVSDNASFLIRLMNLAHESKMSW
jgi:hypothetical protein